MLYLRKDLSFISPFYSLFSLSISLLLTGSHHNKLNSCLSWKPNMYEQVLMLTDP